MISKYQAIYAGGNLSAPSAGVLLIYALGTGTIKTVRVKVRTANGAGATVFNLSKNGVDQFTTELTIPAGQTSVSATGLAIAVAFGDVLVLKLESISAGGVVAPVALQFESEETIILSAADLGADLDAIRNLTPSNDDILQRKAGAWTNRTVAQLKSDLALNNVDNTSDATKNAAAVTLTNKTLTTPTIASFANANHNHQDAAGGGTLAESSLALTDITTNNVSTSKHGFAPKLPNDATKYLDGTGAYSVPAGGGGGGYDGGRPSNSTLSNAYKFWDFDGGDVLNNQAAEWQAFGGSLPVMIAGENHHPGIYRATSNSTSPAGIKLGGTAAARPYHIDLNFDLNFIVRCNNLTNAINRIGLFEAPDSATLPQICFEKLNTDTDFFGCLRTTSGGGTTRSSPVGTPTAATWYRFRIRRINSTTIGFTFNGGTEQTITHSSLSLTFYLGYHISSTDGTNKTSDIDFADIAITGMTRY